MLLEPIFHNEKVSHFDWYCFLKVGQNFPEFKILMKCYGINFTEKKFRFVFRPEDQRFSLDRFVVHFIFLLIPV